MKKFKNDWNQASRKERVKYLIFITLEIFGGIYAVVCALRFVATENFNLLWQCEIGALFMTVFLVMPWKDKTLK
jgi:hypothetical protein